MVSKLETTDYDVLFTKKEIQKKILELAQQINDEYFGKKVVIICTLYGAKRFSDELRKLLTGEHEYDEIRISTYKGAQSSVEQGIIKHVKDLSINLAEKHVIILEDTIDTGFSALYLKYNLGLQNPASLKIFALINKPDGRKPWIRVDPDYACFTVHGNPVIAGFGLDFDDQFRDRDDVIILKEKFCEKNGKN